MVWSIYPYTPTNLKGKFVILVINNPNKRLKKILLGISKAKIPLGFPLTRLMGTFRDKGVTICAEDHLLGNENKRLCVQNGLIYY